ncbi:MAG: Nif3-like dinuclear metal center hexameric protein [Ruminococcus sp.]|nr:Nif3-like dinuclear metal center hexameric protein [Ruminococcus sp.]
MTVNEIYSYINSFAPFCAQESWDNSGLLVGDGKNEVKSIMLCLDITKAVALEAKAKNVSLVISHHPVIFSPLKALSPENPAVILASSGISAICMHTSFDFANGGLNDFLAKKLALGNVTDDAIDENSGLGRIIKLDKEMTAREIAKAAKQALGCKVVRVNNADKKVSTLGVISGSGADYFRLAANKGCDALLTGDVKHDKFIDALNENFSIIDASHYYTENIITEFLMDKLKGLDEEIFVACEDKDITETI